MFRDFTYKIKPHVEKTMHEWGIAIIVLLVGIGSFGLGRLSSLELVRPPVSIIEAKMTPPRGMSIGGLIVAARSGKAYYYPWCAGFSKISEQNMIWFRSEIAAQNAGYVAAKNCKGLGK